jgi:hypothetical protein
MLSPGDFHGKQQIIERSPFGEEKATTTREPGSISGIFPPLGMPPCRDNH